LVLLLFPPGDLSLVHPETFHLGIPPSLRTLPAKFLLNSFLSKLAPLTNYITDSDAELNDETKSVM
jgi:hypothetical protein